MRTESGKALLYALFVADIRPDRIKTGNLAARCRRNMVDDAINIRGLKRYAVERAVVLLFGSYVSERELPLAVTQAYEQEDDTEPSALSVPLEGATLEDVEREAILRMLDSVGDNKSEAAKRLGISRKTLHTKLKRYGQEQD